VTNTEKDKYISRLADSAMLLRCIQILLKSYGLAVRTANNTPGKTVEQKERDQRNLARAQDRIRNIADLLVDNPEIPAWSEEDKFG
jgi:hypothetical protein